MGLTITFAKLAMPLLLVLGVLGTHKLAMDNGLFDMIDLAIAAKKLPESSLTLKTHWTGIGPLDNFLSLMVCFFHTINDGVRPGATLQGAHFLGQLGSIWVLLVVESFRVGNAWKAISFITLWGLAMENIAVAVAVPIYCFVHLLTSPMARSPESMLRAARKASLLVHPTDLAVLPWSAAIGHFIPAILTFSTSAAVIAPIYASSQFWTVVRLFHPAITALIHNSLSLVIPAGNTAYVSPTQRNRDVLRSLQSVYTFASLIGVVLHVGTGAVLLCSQLLPFMFAPEYQLAFHPSTVMKPESFWERPQVKISSISAGAAAFIQWDEITMCAAVLLWAFALNRQSLSKEASASSYVSALFKTVLMTVIAGPAAAAISLIKERDQVVLDLEDVREDKKLM